MTLSVEAKGLGLLLQYIYRFRFITHILFIIWLFIDYYFYPHTALAGIYILYMITIGICYWNRWGLLIISGLASAVRYVASPLDFPRIELIPFQWFAYFSIAFMISSVLKNDIESKQNKMDLIITLAQSLDSRDKYTSNHSQSVAHYARLIAKEMKLPHKLCEDIYLGGLLHDIGKIGVPEAILNKNGKLTCAEFEEIMKHPVLGYNMVKHLTIFQKNGILDMILSHHERYDGQGYPKGLQGGRIPQVARIMALADTFDAMTSKRVYRESKDIDYAISEIRNNRGSQFDPHIADVFLTILERGRENIFVHK
jgi:putative nucleotidyltransferase with HDIG domain